MSNAYFPNVLSLMSNQDANVIIFDFLYRLFCIWAIAQESPRVSGVFQHILVLSFLQNIFMERPLDFLDLRMFWDVCVEWRGGARKVNISGVSKGKDLDFSNSSLLALTAKKLRFFSGNFSRSLQNSRWFRALRGATSETTKTANNKVSGSL